MVHEHFKGKYEVELKYHLSSKSAFLDVLHSMKHEVMLIDNTDSDCYFDTENKHLSNQKKSVCIREMEPSGIKLWIVKGPEPDRCEATNITNAHNAKSMLKTMGYDIVLEMKKQRSIYFIGKYHVTVDHLDGLGDFAEFAIMTDEEDRLDHYREELISLAQKFSLTHADLEHKSYRELQSEQVLIIKNNKVMI
ncbi:MAG: class IV adenylate cyclase [Aliivibrio sp.]|uniref:class IV adenylate cyclase n=1 Tax=Aliivibrio sp. TaxID=1872443 RepID=UPI001A567397|nr:class IV adenylate cyclase [Aliivibrio sp.]